MDKKPFISLIIPNHNGAATIGKCLDSACRSRYEDFEIIVVDDCSTDGSAEIIEGYRCKLIRLAEHSGASAARNAGALSARGDALLFIDSDCVLREDTLEVAARAYCEDPGAVTGGTYTPLPHDRGFFSTFQSIFVNYSETKRPEPDYVATHAMLIGRGLFERSGGFREDFMPILEDVEFSHRLRRQGTRLRMEPALMVEHIFNYSVGGSLRNAFRKSMYWTMYSIGNRDLFSDSGTASHELKADVLSWLACASLLSLYLVTAEAGLLGALAVVCGLNLFVNRRFLKALSSAAGPAFAVGAALYYTTLYPLAVGAGGFVGALRR